MGALLGKILRIVVMLAYGRRENGNHDDGEPLVFRLGTTTTTDQIIALDNEASRSWAVLPEPPDGLSRGQLLMRLLNSQGYSMNPRTYSWPGSTDLTYQSLWYICVKLGSRGHLSHLVHLLTAGRSSEGYMRSMGLRLVESGMNERRLGVEPEISKLFKLDKAASMMGLPVDFPESSDTALEVEPYDHIETTLEGLVLRASEDSVVAGFS